MLRVFKPTAGPRWPATRPSIMPWVRVNYEGRRQSHSTTVDPDDGDEFEEAGEESGEAAGVRVRKAEQVEPALQEERVNENQKGRFTILSGTWSHPFGN